MNYNIESVIKRLQDAQKAGKTIIDEKEQVRFLTRSVFIRYSPILILFRIGVL